MRHFFFENLCPSDQSALPGISLRHKIVLEYPPYLTPFIFSKQQHYGKKMYSVRGRTKALPAQVVYLRFFLMYKKIAPPTITRQSTIASIVFNSIYDSSSFFFFLSARLAAITRHATTPTPSSVMPMAIGTSYLSESIPSLTDGVLVMVVSKGTSKV